MSLFLIRLHSGLETSREETLLDEVRLSAIGPRKISHDRDHITANRTTRRLTKEKNHKDALTPRLSQDKIGVAGILRCITSATFVLNLIVFTPGRFRVVHETQTSYRAPRVDGPRLSAAGFETRCPARSRLPDRRGLRRRPSRRAPPRAGRGIGTTPTGSRTGVR